MLYTLGTQWIFLFLIELSFIYLESSFNLKSTEDWTENQRTSKHLPIIISLSFSLSRSLFLSLSLTHTHTQESSMVSSSSHIFQRPYLCCTSQMHQSLKIFFIPKFLAPFSAISQNSQIYSKTKENSPIQLINYMK